jgi:hypothetical protein
MAALNVRIAVRAKLEMGRIPKARPLDRAVIVFHRKSVKTYFLPRKSMNIFEQHQYLP